MILLPCLQDNPDYVPLIRSRAHLSLFLYINLSHRTLSAHTRCCPPPQISRDTHVDSRWRDVAQVQERVREAKARADKSKEDGMRWGCAAAVVCVFHGSLVFALPLYSSSVDLVTFAFACPYVSVCVFLLVSVLVSIWIDYVSARPVCFGLLTAVSMRLLDVPQSPSPLLHCSLLIRSATPPGDKTGKHLTVMQEGLIAIIRRVNRSLGLPDNLPVGIASDHSPQARTQVQCSRETDATKNSTNTTEHVSILLWSHSKK
jgi:hypothetical protein